MLKGKACINCRRRKIKCDGERPSCGQCARSNGTFEDCEYPNGGLTQTQMLEDRISHVQSRIRELESPSEPISVALHHPYSCDSLPRLARNAAQAKRSSSSLSSSPPSLSANNANLGSVQEPPREVMLILIDIFYQHCRRFGFFLNIERFHQSLLLPLPIGHHARPSCALLNAVYLWGSHLSPSLPGLESYDEKGFLRNTLYHLSKDLASSHPQKIIHGIQAEVLLSYYYLKHGKVLGGNYHANAAVSLTLSAGLHRIRTAENETSPADSPYSSTLALPSPHDVTEEGERIDAFWAVLILNNYWVAIQESHSMFYDIQNLGVDTPWPMDTVEYQLHLLPRVSSGTIKRFLENTSIEGFSVMALHAKAAVLLEQATVLKAQDPTQYDPSALMGGGQPINQSEAFQRLDQLIEQFKSHFPMLEQMEVQPVERETLFVMQMMTHVATIKLHLPLADEGDMASRQKSLFAAQSIAVLTHNIVPTSSIKIEPIAGVIWTFACEVFAREISRTDSVATGNNAQWSTLLHSIYSQMIKCSPNNVFMKFLVNRLQKNHAAALTFW